MTGMSKGCKKKKVSFWTLALAFLGSKNCTWQIGMGGKDDGGKGYRKAASHQKGIGGRSSLKAKTKLADYPFPRPLCSLPLASKDNT